MTRPSLEHLNIYDAKTHLSRYVHKVEKEGKIILLCRNGEPVAQLAPLPQELKPKVCRFGLMKGKGKVNRKFFDPLTEDELPGFGL